MADIELTIKTNLETSTSKKVYALQRPLDAVKECVVYTIIAENKLMSHSGPVDLKTVRVQLTSIASTYAKLKTLVGQVESAMWATSNGWKIAYPLATKIESKEDELYYSISEWYIQYK